MHTNLAAAFFFQTLGRTLLSVTVFLFYERLLPYGKPIFDLNQIGTICPNDIDIEITNSPRFAREDKFEL